MEINPFEAEKLLNFLRRDLSFALDIFSNKQYTHHEKMIISNIIKGELSNYINFLNSTLNNVDSNSNENIVDDIPF